MSIPIRDKYFLSICTNKHEGTIRPRSNVKPYMTGTNLHFESIQTSKARPWSETPNFIQI